MAKQQRLLSKSAFSRMAGVSPAAITKQARPGGLLEPALVGSRINIDHQAVVEYLAGKDVVPAPPPKVFSVSATAKQKKKTQAKPPEIPIDIPEDDSDLIDMPEDAEAFLDMKLRDLVAQFGTDQRFEHWLKATKEIEWINEKRLKNATAKGLLVSRELIKMGIIDPYEAAHIRLLTAGAKTIRIRTIAMHEAGESEEKQDAFIKDQISSHLKPVKAKVKRIMQDVVN